MADQTADQGDELAEAELAARLRVAVTRLERRLRQHSLGGMSPSKMSAMASIVRLGTPTLKELAATELVQPPSMTRVIDGLEQAGYVKRVTDPIDRRVVRVEVSAEGRRVMQRNRLLRTAFLAKQLERLPEEDRAAFGDLTALLERLVELDEP